LTVTLIAVLVILAGCGSDHPVPLGSTPSVGPSPVGQVPAAEQRLAPGPTRSPGTPAKNGNPTGKAAIPAEARAADTSHPTRVIGNGTAASCTSAAVVSAVAKGGIITFACGPAPVTIAMTATAKVRNNTGAKIVLDGGGLVTLSGGGKRRILYMNTCDKAQVWTTSHCNDQAEPRLVLKRLRLVRGNSTGETTDGGGGGAVFVRGGRLTIVDSTFADNR
jgi:hypothetical protein